MRIKKPTKKQDYLVYNNIAERDAAKEKFKNGQEVKLIDASGDENIDSGWAIYKYDKETDVFDLLEKEEEGIIETIEPDYKTCSKGVDSDGNEVIVIPELMQVYDNQLEFLKDFDINVYVYPSGSYNKITIAPKDMTGDLLKIPIKTKDGVVWMNLKVGYAMSYSFKEGVCHVSVSAYCCSDENDTRSTYYTKFDKDNGFCQQLNSSVSPIGGSGVPLMIIKFKVDENKAVVSGTVHVWKFWKNALAEEEITIPEIPDGIQIDNSTVKYSAIKQEGVAQRFSVPNALKLHHQNVKILKDFDFDFEATGDYLYINPRGVNTGTTLNIPVSVNGVTKYAKIKRWQINKSMFDDTVNEYHCIVSAYIKDTEQESVSGMLNQFSSQTGQALLGGIASLDGQTLPLFQIKARKPQTGGTFDLNYVVVYKYWKNALAPAEERITIPEIPETNGYILDEVTLFEDRLDEQTKIIAPALAQTHPVNFWILEDFDFNFEVGQTYTGSKTYLDVKPVGGNRHVPVLVNGTRKYMSVSNEQVIMPDLFGTGFGGNYKYFTLHARIDDTEDTLRGLGAEYQSSGKAWLPNPYPNDTHFVLAMIGVKFESDGLTLDWKNVKVFKYWKNCLAPFNELWAEKTAP